MPDPPPGRGEGEDVRAGSENLPKVIEHRCGAQSASISAGHHMLAARTRTGRLKQEDPALAGCGRRSRNAFAAF